MASLVVLCLCSYITIGSMRSMYDTGASPCVEFMRPKDGNGKYLNSTIFLHQPTEKRDSTTTNGTYRTLKYLIVYDVQQYVILTIFLNLLTPYHTVLPSTISMIITKSTWLLKIVRGKPPTIQWFIIWFIIIFPFLNSGVKTKKKNVNPLRSGRTWNFP